MRLFRFVAYIRSDGVDDSLKPGRDHYRVPRGVTGVLCGDAVLCK